jgi:hypothetical protein
VPFQQVPHAKELDPAVPGHPVLLEPMPVVGKDLWATMPRTVGEQLAVSE